MNNTIATSPNENPKPTPHLLDAIKAIRASVGDGLNEDELTRLLRQATLLSEAGFGFLSLSGGVVTLSVPHQELKSWHSDHAWLPQDKVKIARAIAHKHQLSLSEPPNTSPSFLFPSSEPASPHHYFVLSNRWEPIVIAHPHYLKVRLFGTAPGCRYDPNARHPLLLSSDLLPDLSALYQP
jgi:hypothetical protein